MSKSKYVNAALAATVALPAIATPAAAIGKDHVVKPAENIVVAQATKTAKRKKQERAAKKELASALRRMPSAEKAKLGKSRMKQLQSLSGGDLVRAGCFTHGVGCGGTPQFSQGVICCAIIKTTI